MDREDIEKFRQQCRPIPISTVLHYLFSVRFIRWENKRLNQLNGWMVICSFGIGSIAIKFNARDWHSYLLFSGIELWLWPNRVHFVEGDQIFRYRWKLEDRISI